MSVSNGDQVLENEETNTSEVVSNTLSLLLNSVNNLIDNTHSRRTPGTTRDSRWHAVDSESPNATSRELQDHTVTSSNSEDIDTIINCSVTRKSSSTESSELGPDHWSKDLKCSVCLDYFEEPCVLPCGHTFCNKCIRYIIEHTQTSRPRVSPQKLKFWCPNCRKSVLAKVFFARCTRNLALRYIVDGWLRKERHERINNFSTMAEKSVQTDADFVTSKCPNDEECKLAKMEKQVQTESTEEAKHEILNSGKKDILESKLNPESDVFIPGKSMYDSHRVPNCDETFHNINQTNRQQGNQQTVEYHSSSQQPLVNHYVQWPTPHFIGYGIPSPPKLFIHPHYSPGHPVVNVTTTSQSHAFGNAATNLNANSNHNIVNDDDEDNTESGEQPCGVGGMIPKDSDVDLGGYLFVSSEGDVIEEAVVDSDKKEQIDKDNPITIQHKTFQFCKFYLFNVLNLMSCVTIMLSALFYKATERNFYDINSYEMDEKEEDLNDNEIAHDIPVKQCEAIARIDSNENTVHTNTPLIKPITAQTLWCQTAMFYIPFIIALLTVGSVAIMQGHKDRIDSFSFTVYHISELVFAVTFPYILCKAVKNGIRWLAVAYYKITIRHQVVIERNGETTFYDLIIYLICTVVKKEMQKIMEWLQRTGVDIWSNIPKENPFRFTDGYGSESEDEDGDVTSMSGEGLGAEDETDSFDIYRAHLLAE